MLERVWRYIATLLLIATTLPALGTDELLKLVPSKPKFLLVADGAKTAQLINQVQNNPAIMTKNQKNH